MVAGIGQALSNPFKGKEPVGDFFAPFFRVTFLTGSSTPGEQLDAEGEPVSSGSEITQSGEILTSQGGTTIRFSDNDEMSQLRSYATSLEITDEGGGLSIARLHMEPPFDDAIAIVDNRVVQWNSIMKIEFGWLPSESGGENKVSDTHYFMIQQPSLSVSSTDVSIDIIGVDLFGYMLTKKSKSKKWVREDGNKADIDIIRKLALKGNLTVDTSGAPQDSLIFQEHPVDDEPAVLEQNEVDWIFFNELVARNNCSFFTIGDKVFIVDINHIKSSEPSYRLLMFQQPTDIRDIPILSFNVNAEADLFWRPEAKETTVNHHDMDTGKVTTEKTDPAKDDTNPGIGGTRTSSGKDEADGKTIDVDDNTSVTPNPVYEDDETGKVFSVPSRINNRGELVKQPAKWAGLVANTDMTVTVPGSPSIVPMMIVEVQFGSEVFKGNYIVMKATHRLSTDGYETDLKLTRDTSTGDVSAGHGEQVSAGGNTKSTDKAGGEAVSPVGPDGEAPTKTRRNVRIS